MLPLLKLTERPSCKNLTGINYNFTLTLKYLNEKFT